MRQVGFGVQPRVPCFCCPTIVDLYLHTIKFVLINNLLLLLLYIFASPKIRLQSDWSIFIHPQVKWIVVLCHHQIHHGVSRSVYFQVDRVHIHSSSQATVKSQQNLERISYTLMIFSW